MINNKIVQKILNKYNLDDFIYVKKQGGGITGSVFDINGKYILKIQNDKTDNFRSERNAFVYKILEKNNIKAPKLISLDTSKKIIPEKYVLATKLGGENLRDIWQSLSKDEQKKIFFKFGELMAKFHQIELKKFGDPVDKSHQFDDWYNCIRNRFEEHFSYTNKNNIISPKLLERIDKFFNKNDEFLHVNTKPVLIHNDFQAKNIKYFKGELNGIFDFDECLAAHNEMDFLKSCLPFKREKIWLDEILRGYNTMGELSDEFFQRIKLYMINFCLKILKFQQANEIITDQVKTKFSWAVEKIMEENWKYFKD